MNNVKQPRSFSREALAEFVAAEVEQILVRYDKEMNKPVVITGGLVAGAVVAAFAGLSHMQQEALSKNGHRVSRELTTLIAGLATEFFRSGQVSDRTAEEESQNQTPAPVSIKVDDWAGQAAGPTQLELEYGIYRKTLYRLHKRNAVIGLKTGGRKHVYPLAQFIDGRPVDGLVEINTILAPPRVAWFWLTHPCDALGGVEPLELLKLDRIDEVVVAAREYAEATKIGSQ
ncbi:hypothetical protein [Pseudaminobacter soli (ex Li et al. 2025)]|uniref:antitoxin Xre/MbcA/ParS-like domain-containing protein n=1 Tax=Pseudaminobacter soli (ex Li et al. 2025) TaxID=1295366 RepID=UPI000D0FA097|nr:hypothetical protein [Mesorhizobium soli]